MAVGSVNCDGVMVARYVHDARGNDGRRFGGHFFRNRVRANFRELLHIARRDLSQRAVARPVEIVIRIGPVPVVAPGRDSRQELLRQSHGWSRMRSPAPRQKIESLRSIGKLLLECGKRACSFYFPLSEIGCAVGSAAATFLRLWTFVKHRREFRSAGVSPAVFPLSIHCKTAGGTPALQL